MKTERERSASTEQVYFRTLFSYKLRTPALTPAERHLPGQYVNTLGRWSIIPILQTIDPSGLPSPSRMGAASLHRFPVSSSCSSYAYEMWSLVYPSITFQDRCLMIPDWMPRVSTGSPRRLLWGPALVLGNAKILTNLRQSVRKPRGPENAPLSRRQMDGSPGHSPALRLSDRSEVSKRPHGDLASLLSFTITIPTVQ